MFLKNYNNNKIKTENISCIICNSENNFFSIGNGYDYEFKTNKQEWFNCYCVKCDHFFYIQDL